MLTVNDRSARVKGRALPLLTLLDFTYTAFDRSAVTKCDPLGGTKPQRPTMAINSVTGDQVQSYLKIKNIVDSIRSDRERSIGNVVGTYPVLTKLWTSITARKRYAISCNLGGQGMIIDNSDWLEGQEGFGSLDFKFLFSMMLRSQPSGDTSETSDEQMTRLASTSGIELDPSEFKVEKTLSNLMIDQVGPMISKSLYEGKAVELKLSRLTLLNKGAVYVPNAKDSVIVKTGALSKLLELPPDSSVRRPEGELDNSSHNLQRYSLIAYRHSLGHKVIPAAKGFGLVASFDISIVDAARSSLHSDESSIAPSSKARSKVSSKRLGSKLNWDEMYTDDVKSFSDDEIKIRSDQIDQLAKQVGKAVTHKRPIGFLLKHNYSEQEVKESKLRGVDLELFNAVIACSNVDTQLHHAIRHTQVFWDRGMKDYGAGPEDKFDPIGDADGPPVTESFIYPLRSRSHSDDADDSLSSYPPVAFIEGPRWTELSTNISNGMNCTCSADPTSRIRIDVMRTGTILLIGGLRLPCPPPPKRRKVEGI